MSQTDKEFSIDYSQDPRKVFVNFLIWNIKGIETELYYPGRRSWLALQLLVGLIDCLDGASKEHLKEQHEKLIAMSLGTEGLGHGDLEEIFRDIMTYLHQTYLQEFIRVRPLNPHPKHIKAEENERKSPIV